jgi:hypothetical protein
LGAATLPSLLHEFCFCDYPHFTLARVAKELIQKLGGKGASLLWGIKKPQYSLSMIIQPFRKMPFVKREAAFLH